jgi:serine protease Do
MQPAKRASGRRRWRGALTLVICALPFLACCRRTGGTFGAGSDAGAPLPSGAIPVPPASQGAHGGPQSEPPPSPAPQVILPGGMAAPLSFAPLVKATDNAVVTVFAIVRNRRRGQMIEGLGSGFVYDSNGYILTNNHVVAEATEIMVRLADDRRVSAKLVGRDPPTDVAVVKIDVPGVPALQLGDSNAIDVGDWVVAIGNPFGLSHTVSAGIISAKGRTRDDLKELDQTGHGYFNFLQTDAAINQGNSGGPLINLKGEVVGINTAIRANANSIGFAIPINMVKSLVPMLVRDGKVTRSALGISVAALGEEDVARLRRPSKKGAILRGVQPGGAADRAGLATDDVIVAFNGTTIDDPEELRWLASVAGVGSTALVRVSRGDRTFDVKVKLGALPDDPTELTPPVKPGIPGFP